jgi:hypothetical protein
MKRRVRCNASMTMALQVSSSTAVACRGEEMHTVGVTAGSSAHHVFFEWYFPFG